MAAKIDWAVLEGADPDTIDALLREDFALFAQAMYPHAMAGGPLVWAPFLDLISSRLQAVANGELRQLIITLPPRHLKSYLVSIAFVAYLLGHDPTRSVMCVSYGQDLADQLGSHTRKLMESSPYRAIFGEVLERRGQAPAMLRTRAGGVRRATSLSGPATGSGADVLIFDDPQKPGETLSDTVRRATNYAYEQTFLSRRNDPSTCRTVIVMQRLHEDDFVSHVQGLGGDWEVLNLPVIAEEDETVLYTDILGYQAVYRRAKGQPLHPTRIPLSKLAQMRLEMGEYVWTTQYMQAPAPAGGGLVKVAGFRRYEERPSHFERIVQSWDSASTISEWSDFSVCTTWGVLDDNFYLLDVFRERLDYPALKHKVLELARLYGAQVVYVEDRASGIQLNQELSYEGFARVRPVKANASKQQRMVEQTGLIDSGRVHVPKEAPRLDEYLHELAMFPNGKYDDQVDSTSQALAQMAGGYPGRGLFEFMRQEAERAQRPLGDEPLVRVRAPGSIGQVTDIEGRAYLRAADGCYHLPRSFAQQSCGQLGWSPADPMT